MEPTLAHAVADNVAWCELVCRSLGVGTCRADDLWWCIDDSPPLYPDIITTAADVPLDRLLALLDERPVCSVKDSHAVLDLSGEGFEALVDATWIGRPPVVPEREDPEWGVLVNDADLTAWERAWLKSGGAEASMTPLLLVDDTVVFIAQWLDEEVVAGAVAHRGAGLLGISNVFGAEADLGELWPRAAAAVSWLAPEQAVVGYELGAGLHAAQTVGFVALGPLRVWRRG